jgi:pimeloyl-ACP methyl ester carboxylesterase
MGGMIAQLMAISQPRRVRSLTSIMSTTGKRTVGWQHPSLIPTLLAARGPSREAYVQGSAAVWRLIGSPAYPQPPERTESRARDTYDRGVSASGVLRQMLAVVTQSNRGPRLHSLNIPAMVIHGLADKMVHVSGGRATAAAIPGAELLLIDGMGHDLPPELFDTFVGAIRRTADRSAT